MGVATEAVHLIGSVVSQLWGWWGETGRAASSLGRRAGFGGLRGLQPSQTSAWSNGCHWQPLLQRIRQNWSPPRPSRPLSRALRAGPGAKGSCHLSLLAHYFVRMHPPLDETPCSLYTKKKTFEVKTAIMIKNGEFKKYSLKSFTVKLLAKAK